MDIKFYKTKGPHGYLSNFWRHPIALNGLIFPTSEHLYQSLKVGATDPATFAAIVAAGSPREAADLGRAAENVRLDWLDVRVDAMRLALLLKFENDGLLAKLLETGSATLIEETPHGKDGFWGQTEGQGQNMLGQLLMETRAFYRGLAEDSPHEATANICDRQSELCATLRSRKYRRFLP